jgi:hypothetical protein
MEKRCKQGGDRGVGNGNRERYFVVFKMGIYLLFNPTLESFISHITVTIPNPVPFESVLPPFKLSVHTTCFCWSE